MTIAIPSSPISSLSSTVTRSTITSEMNKHPKSDQGSLFSMKNCSLPCDKQPPKSDKVQTLMQYCYYYIWIQKITLTWCYIHHNVYIIVIVNRLFVNVCINLTILAFNSCYHNTIACDLSCFEVCAFLYKLFLIILTL